MSIRLFLNNNKNINYELSWGFQGNTVVLKNCQTVHWSIAITFPQNEEGRLQCPVSKDSWEN